MNLAAFTRTLLICLLAAPAACSIEPPQPNAFYDWRDGEMPGAAGELLRFEPFAGAPDGAKAWKVLYRSTGLDGEPVAVSGVVIAPDSAAPAGERRPVVAWAHPTTGVAANCAPSLSARFAFERLPGLAEFLKRGYVIAATDYPGLGTPGPHPYLVGVSEGRAVLDSVRAAGHLDEAAAGGKFAIWGHSQGGHAALYAGQLAPDYAPELELAGVAAAAPATELATLFEDDLNTRPGKVLTAFSLWSWHRVYDAPLSSLLAPETEDAVNEIATSCIEDKLEGLAAAHREKSIDQDFLKADLTQTEPWKSLLARNTPRAAMPVPLFLAQGSADTIVRPQVTVNYARSVCATGTPVNFTWLDGVTHNQTGFDSASDAAEWMASRFEGKPPASDCGDLPEPKAANP